MSLMNWDISLLFKTTLFQNKNTIALKRHLNFCFKMLSIVFDNHVDFNKKKYKKQKNPSDNWKYKFLGDISIVVIWILKAALTFQFKGLSL